MKCVLLFLIILFEAFSLYAADQCTEILSTAAFESSNHSNVEINFNSFLKQQLESGVITQTELENFLHDLRDGVLRNPISTPEISSAHSVAAEIFDGMLKRPLVVETIITNAELLLVHQSQISQDALQVNDQVTGIDFDVMSIETDEDLRLVLQGYFSQSESIRRSDLMIALIDRWMAVDQVQKAVYFDKVIAKDHWFLNPEIIDHYFKKWVSYFNLPSSYRGDVFVRSIFKRPDSIQHVDKLIQWISERFTAPYESFGMGRNVKYFAWELDFIAENSLLIEDINVINAILSSEFGRSSILAWKAMLKSPTSLRYPELMGFIIFKTLSQKSFSPTSEVFEIFEVNPRWFQYPELFFCFLKGTRLSRENTAYLSQIIDNANLRGELRDEALVIFHEALELRRDFNYKIDRGAGFREVYESELDRLESELHRSIEKKRALIPVGPIMTISEPSVLPSTIGVPTGHESSIEQIIPNQLPTNSSLIFKIRQRFIDFWAFLKSFFQRVGL